jgi:MFS family permease
VARIPPALQYRDFRIFWTGAVLSAVGSEFTMVAMAWQVYDLTSSPLQVGLLGLGRALPQMALSMYGGLLADAIDRKRLMMVLQLMQCTISTVLALLAATGTITPGALFAAAVLLALCTALENPSRTAIVPNLVPREGLASAVALITTQRSIAMIAGPSLAGIMLAIAGPTPCYVLDAASWFAMLTALLLITEPVQTAATGTISMQALAAGVKFVLSRQVIFAFMVLNFGATFFGSTIALMPVYARDILHVGEVELGLLYAANSVGAIVAGTMLSARGQVNEAGKWVLIGTSVYALCTIGFGLSNSFVLSLILLACSGAGGTVSAILRSVANQVLTPDEFRGRVASVNSVFVMGGPQLGQFESGAVASLFNTRFSTVSGGVGAFVLTAIIALLPRVRSFRFSDAASEKPVA